MKANQDLIAIAAALAKLAETILILAETEMHGLNDGNVKASIKSIKKRLENSRPVTPEEIKKYALSLPMVARSPTMKHRPHPKHVTELAGDGVDYVEGTGHERREPKPSGAGADLDTGTGEFDKEDVREGGE